MDHTFDPNNLTEELYLSKMGAIQENFEKCQHYAIGEDVIYNNYLKNMNL